MAKPSPSPARRSGPAITDPVAVVTGSVSLLLGALFLGFASVLRGSLSTHFSLAVMGGALIAMGLNRPAAACWLAIPIGLLNLATFVGYVSFGPPGLDTLIIEAVWPTAPKCYSGDLNADLGYALTAAAILLLTHPDWKLQGRSTAIVLAASAILGLGAVGLAGYITGLRTAYGLRRLVEVSADSIVGILLLGAGLLAVTWRRNRHVPAERDAWILMAIATSGVVVSTSLWQALLLVHTLPMASAQEFRVHAARIVLTFGLLASGVLVAAVSFVQKLRNLNEELRRQVQRAEKEVTERKRAEETLEQKLQELARTDADLREFLRAGSHDLQEPLRPIVSFSQLLAKRYGGRLDAQAEELIEHLVSAGVRMKALIDALLACARPDRQGPSAV